MVKPKKRAAKATPPKAREAPIGPDARGRVRVYADISEAAAVELAVQAARRRISKKALLEMLIEESARRKVGSR